MKKFLKKVNFWFLSLFVVLETGAGNAQSLTGVPQLKQLLTGLLDVAAGIYVIKIIFDIMAHSSEVSGGNHQAKVKLYVSIAMLVVILSVVVFVNYTVFLATQSGMTPMNGLLPGR
jgi:hypothetical protein